MTFAVGIVQQANLRLQLWLLPAALAVSGHPRQGEGGSAAAEPPLEDGDEAAPALLLHRSRGLHTGQGGPVVLGLLNCDINIIL